MNIVAGADYPGLLVFEQIVKPGDIREAEVWTEVANGSEVMTVVVGRWGDMVTMSLDTTALVSPGVDKETRASSMHRRVCIGKRTRHQRNIHTYTVPAVNLLRQQNTPRK
jgi:hypothetical protein